MECLVALNKGFEDICRQEIKEILGKKAASSDGFLKIKLDEKELLKLVYLMRSAKNIFVEEKNEKKLVVNDSRKFIVKNNPPNLNCSLAYCLARYSGYKGKDVLLDVLCCGSKILIEAWHFANKIPAGKFIDLNSEFFKDIKDEILFEKAEEKNNLEIYGMDSYTGNIEDSKLNVQSAGADIKLSARSIDWADCLFDEKSVDKIITYLPSGSGASTDALYRELFYQGKYCLKKNGIVVLLSKRAEAVEKYAKLFGFKVLEKRESDIGVVFKIKNVNK